MPLLVDKETRAVGGRAIRRCNHVISELSVRMADSRAIIIMIMIHPTRPLELFPYSAYSPKIKTVTDCVKE
jgi:hypothetical protein